MNNKTIGKRIQLLRKEKLLTQKQLADEVGVTPQAISKWETDESCPDITALPLLAKTLGVTTDILLGADTDTTVSSGIAASEATDSSDSSHLFGVKKGGRIAALMAGLYIIFLGTLLIIYKVNVEGVGDISFWSLMWPSAIIFLGLGGCFNRDTLCFSLGVSASGTLFLLKNLGVIDGSVWPLTLAIIFILTGISIIIRLVTKKAASASRFSNDSVSCDYFEADGTISYSVKFGEAKIVSKLDTFKKGKISTAFGSFALDLSSIDRFEEDSLLELSVSFGEFTLILPRNVNLKLDNSFAFSGKNIEGTHNSDAPYTLSVRGKVAFGNLAIEYR